MQYGTGRARTLLGTELHSTRPAASAGRGINRMQSSKSNSTPRRVGLFIAKSVNGIELGSTRSRIEPGSETHKHGKAERRQHQPPRNGRKFNRIEILAVQINVGAIGERAAQQPAKDHAEYSAQQTHDARFPKANQRQKKKWAAIWKHPEERMR